jgi:MFS family permease
MSVRKRVAVIAVGTGIAEFGDIAFLISLAASLFLREGSSVHVGYAMAAYGLGSLAGAWLGGFVIDRLPARRWLLGGNVVASGIVLSGVLTHSLLSIIVLAGVVSLGSRAMLVGHQSSLALVAPDCLLAANSAVMMCRRIGQLASPAFAGTLVATGNVDAVYVINAGTFIAAGLAGFAATPRAEPGRLEHKRMVDSIWSYARRTPAVRWSFVVNALTGLIVGTSSVAIIVYTKEILHGGAREYGFLASWAAVGAFIGTVTAVSLRSRLSVKRAIAGTMGMGGIALATLPLITWFPGAVVARLGSGWSVNVSFIVLMTSLQEGAPADLRGRLIATTRSGQDVLTIVSTMGSGFLVAAIGVGSVLAVTGALAVLGAVLLAIPRHPFNWQPDVETRPTDAGTGDGLLRQPAYVLNK